MHRHFKLAKFVHFPDSDIFRGTDFPQYDSLHEAAAAWSGIYRTRSIHREYAAIIYSLHINGKEKYYIRRTHKGMGAHRIIRPNVVLPFLYMYFIQAIIERIIRKAKIAAFIHTHPKPPIGYSCKNHSAEDLFLLKLPRISAVYVIPYENNDINGAFKQEC